MSKNIQGIMLDIAEIMDAWRIIPRLLVALYGFMIYELFIWYTKIPTHEEQRCNEALITTLVNNNIPIERAMEMACTIIDTVGGPTTQQTSFVTVIIGLSSAMFGFYVNSGGDSNKRFKPIFDDGNGFVYSKKEKSNSATPPD